MFIFLAMKHYKELWRVEDRVSSGHLKSVRAESTIRTVREWNHQNPPWKQKIMSQKLKISTQSSCVSSGTIYTWGRTSAQNVTSLLLLWKKSDIQEQSLSSSGTQRTGMKTSSSWMKKFSSSRSSIITSETRFMLKHPLRCILSVQGSHSLHTSWFGRRRPIRGVTHLHFCKKGVKLVSECIKRACYKELWNILTWPSSLVRNGSSSRTQFLPKRPRQLGSGCGGTFWPLSVPRIGFWGVQISKPWTINCGLFWRTWRAESVTTAWRVWGDPLWRQKQRYPGDRACGDSRVAGAFQGLHPGIGRPFWVTLL